MSSVPDQVLDLLGLRPRRVVTIRDLPLGNGNWLVETADGQRTVLRRYHDRTTRDDLAYEHAVLSHLASAGWTVPAPASEPIHCENCWYCLTRHVPGEAVRPEDTEQWRRRAAPPVREGRIRVPPPGCHTADFVSVN
jgi:hypothetical protein